MRAAQYVRMSTEHQQYSILNQQAAIAEYAKNHGYEVVRTYADPARSGLDIKHRPGLQSLIDDALYGRADFQAVLVFDISRWGRFQDNDEAACYEFLCKRAGIQVHYCAEQFSNDGSLASAFLKTVKRTMAAEYLRELSAKVHSGQCRLAANGFKLGGRAGYGLRRVLLDSNGSPKLILQDGERKSMTTERVTYALGPEQEVRVVREIFSMFLEQNLPVRGIARVLNKRGVQRGIFGPWDHMAVFRILTHPKYTGCAVFNRYSEKLRGKRVRNPREQWVLRPGAFPAIVAQDVFDRTQEKLDNMVNRRSNERLLSELSAFLETHGTPLPHLVKPANGTAAASTYARRFGSLMAAYDLIHYRAARYTMSALESRRRLACLRMGVMEEFRQALSDAHIRFYAGTPTFRLRRLGHFILETARCVTTPNGHLRWKVRTRKNCSKHTFIVIRLQPGNVSIKDFVLLRKVPNVVRDFTLDETMVRLTALTCNNIQEIVAAITAWKPQPAVFHRKSTDSNRRI